MRRFLRAAALVAAVFIPGPARAEPCGQRATLVAELSRDRGETPRFRGLTAHGEMLEIFLGRSGSWSVVITRPDGVACLVAVGEDGAVFAPAAASGSGS